MKIDTVGLDTHPKFPNGFRSWMETHHEVVTNMQVIMKNGLPEETKKQVDLYGICVLYDIAESITDKFEMINKGRQWDGDFFEAVDEFTLAELN